MPFNTFYLLVLLLLTSTTLTLASPLGQPVQQTVLPMLIGAACAALIQYFVTGPLRTYRQWLVLLFASCSIWMPGLCFYWPVILFVSPTPITAGAMAITIAIAFSQLTPTFAILILLIAASAWLIARLITALEALRQQLMTTADDAREMESTLKRHYQELIDKQDNEVRIATLDERQRIAREMHDHAGHLLSRALLQLGALMATTPNPEPLAPLKDTIGQAMDSLRTSVHNLHDDAVDLSLQLRQLTTDFSFCTINLNLNFTDEPPTKVRLAVIAIYKEALSNIMRHSNATRVEAALIEHPDFYQFVISDNGTTALGKNFSPIALNHHGMGIANIARRIESLAGHLVIKNANGFTLFMTLPKSQ